MYVVLEFNKSQEKEKEFLEKIEENSSRKSSESCEKNEELSNSPSLSSLSKKSRKTGDFSAEKRASTFINSKNASISKESLRNTKETVNIYKKKASISREPASITREPASISREPASISKETASISKETVSISKETASISKETANKNAEMRRKTSILQIQTNKSGFRKSVMQVPVATNSRSRKNSVSFSFDSLAQTKTEIKTLNNLENLEEEQENTEKNSKLEKTPSKTLNSIKETGHSAGIEEKYKQEIRDFCEKVQDSPQKTEKIANFSQEKPYVRKNLELIAKFSLLRKLKKLKSLEKLPKPATNSKESQETAAEFKEIQQENEFLREALRKKDAVQLFSQQLFLRNKPYQKKLEFILEMLVSQRKSADFFDFLHDFLRFRSFPLHFSAKSSQTERVSAVSAASQADFPSKLPENSKNLKETANILKIIDKLQKTCVTELDYNTTSTSLESKPEKIVAISQKNLDNFVSTARSVQLSQHLHSSQTPKKADKLSQSSSLRKSKDFSQEQRSEFLRKTEKNTEKNLEKIVRLPEFRTEEDLEEDFKENTEKSSREIFEKLKKLQEEKNYAKLKFLINYPFRSINAKFQGKSAEKAAENCENSEELCGNELSYERFHRFFQRMVKAHRTCGNNCVHLRRFYQKIGLKVKGFELKEELVLSKKIINKLPKIF